jgi:polyisoprenyl-teichoic acid--peptidoglycan teichoic acid transferase
MFDQLDDADDFEPGDIFFASTTRRFGAHRRKRNVARLAGGAMCLAVGVPALFVANRTSWVGTVHPTAVADSSATTAAVDPTNAGVITSSDTVPVADPKVQNFLIVGTDNNACVDPSSPTAGGLNAAGHNGLTDTIMVVRVDPATPHMAILSFPRDLWVEIPGQGNARINSAYERNNPQRLIDTLMGNFGVPIDHFIQVDFCAFKKLVDAIGGVTVPMSDTVRDVTTGFVSDAGCHTFGGDEALAYVRSRHLEYLEPTTGQWLADPTSDLGRTARQRDFLMRTLTSAAKAGLLQPKLLTALYSSYKNDIVVDTGLTIDRMIEFVGVLRSVGSADNASFQIEAASAKISGNDVLIPQMDSPNVQSILSIFGPGPPATSESAIPAPQDNTPPAAIVPDAMIEC